MTRREFIGGVSGALRVSSANATVLQPSEYDASYFDGTANPPTHPAGYGSYTRWVRRYGENSLGEYYLDLAARLAQSNSLQNVKVLEVGCAKGFIVEDLRGMGIDAWGLDVSSYAIGQAAPAVRPFLTVGDARTVVPTYRNNQWDVIFSLRTLECFEDADLAALISAMNSKARRQFHIVDDETRTANPLWYNVKALAQWQALSFRNQTRIVSHTTSGEVIK